MFIVTLIYIKAYCFALHGSNVEFSCVDFLGSKKSVNLNNNIE